MAEKTYPESDSIFHGAMQEVLYHDRLPMLFAQHPLHRDTVSLCRDKINPRQALPEVRRALRES